MYVRLALGSNYRVVRPGVNKRDLFADDFLEIVRSHRQDRRRARGERRAGWQGQLACPCFGKGGQAGHGTRLISREVTDS